MKYSESNGFGVFDWNKFLAEVKLGDDSIYDAKSYAGQWVTCAVGNQCNIIPRYSLPDVPGKPKDILLADLGVFFYHRIKQLAETFSPQEFESYRGRAIETLRSIEQRSAELINEIRSKNEEPAKSIL